MPDNSAHGDGRRKGSVSRRSFVKAVGASGVAAGLAGCTDDESGGGATTTAQTDNGGSTTVQWAGDSRLSDNADALNDLLHEAGLSKDIEVEVLAGSQVTDNRQDQYNQWLSAGREQPSIMMMDSGWTIPFIAREQLASLNGELDSSFISTVEDEYFGASVATAKGQDGDLYGVPLFPDFPTMQYRKDWVEDAGYDPEGESWATESMSWQRFSEVTKDVLENNDDAEHGYTFQADVYEGLSCCDFNEWLTSWGGAYFGAHENLFGPIGDRPITVDEQPVIDSLRMIRTFINGSEDSAALDGFAGNIAADSNLQWTEETSRKPFTDGKAVMHRNWPYSININGADDEYGEDLGVMPIPYGVEASEAEYEGTGGPVAALGGWHACLNPNAQKKDAALEVIRTLTDENFQLEMFGLIGWMPPRPSLLESDRAAEVDVIGRYVDALRVAGENAVPRPVTAVWPQQSEKISQQANAALTGDKSPDQAMGDLKNDLEAIENSA
jgi:ABC-type glycerol-3-phosphate transport system substrate-binding protein